jgi:hypothetical protein
MAHNVLQLGEVAEIEVQMFSFAQKFNRRTAVEFSTKPAILPNCCYRLAFFLSLCFCPLLRLSLVRWLGGSFAFFVGLCAFGKNANVPPKAWAYSSVVLLFIKSSANIFACVITVSTAFS